LKKILKCLKKKKKVGEISLGTGYWVPDAWVLGTGYWVPNAWVLGTGYWVPDAWVLVHASNKKRPRPCYTTIPPKNQISNKYLFL